VHTEAAVAALVAPTLAGYAWPELPHQRHARCALRRSRVLGRRDARRNVRQELRSRKPLAGLLQLLRIWRVFRRHGGAEGARARAGVRSALSGQCGAPPRL
jgi:hypothetical protein